MKTSITYIALLGLSYARGTIDGRAPQSPPTPEIKDLLLNGIKAWGPVGSIKPPASPKPPLHEMPLGLGLPKPPPKSRPDPSFKTGVTSEPGKPLGPQKKCRPCRRKRRLCCSNAGDSIKSSKGSSKAKGSRPAQKSTKTRATKVVGKAAAFALLAPHARGLLEAIKDSLIGAHVRWFDNAMAAAREAIGGPNEMIFTETTQKPRQYVYSEEEKSQSRSKEKRVIFAPLQLMNSRRSLRMQLRMKGLISFFVRVSMLRRVWNICN